MKKVLVSFLPLLFLQFLILFECHAWVYPEHRYILLLAIQRLSPEDRAVLDKLWIDVQKKYNARLTDGIIDPEQGRKPTRLDYAAWAGIAGDHSCSPSEMLQTALESDWILKVADVTAKLQYDLANSKRMSERINGLRDSDIRLQRADVDYATRAGSNNVHFLLARPEVSSTLGAYGLLCLRPKVPLNALGAYSWFHTSAMFKAGRYVSEKLSDDERTALALAILADEAFALHFLEDVFAAGHTAGTWGAASVRKGTHDYYNERGLEVSTWSGDRLIIKGDAYMRTEDADLAAISVRYSLEQIIQVVNGKEKYTHENDILAKSNNADTFNVCKNDFMPERTKVVDDGERLGGAIFLPEVLRKTPVPGLATGTGEIPRFRSEIGLFMGVSTSINLSSISGGFGTQQTQTGFVGALEANFRIGLGMDGVLNDAGDGLVFFQVGLRQDASSSSRYAESDFAIPPGAITAAIPGRSAYDFRFRLPFWAIPGDLLIAGPILLLVSPDALTKMAVTAANGGLIPWQSGVYTSIGRFQFVIGREVGVSFYGVKSLQNDALIIPSGSTNSYFVGYSSTKFDFPFLEYRPLRTFSINQTSSLTFQFSAGVDLPHGASTITPAGAPVPPLKPVYHLGLRIVFDWRKYL